MSMRALRQLTEHVDQQHRQAMTTIHDELGEAHLSQADPGAVATRRNFVRNLGLGGAAIAFGSVMVPVAGLVSQAAAQSTASSIDVSNIPAADTALMVFAQGLELALQSTYEAMIATRKLDSAVQETARLFGRHHGQHATAFSVLLLKNDIVSVPNPKVLALFTPRVDQAADQNALLQVAFDLETGAAATYQLAMTSITWQPASIATTIEPIEAQHATVWGQMLNLPIAQWMPAFQDQADALNPSNFAS